ncbi:hypothetical protein [Nocardioides sp.]|uniref:hypothetical protein n=1 Tax=Nocardioides sp. TaxID=35761 RepID=UPI0039E46005
MPLRILAIAFLLVLLTGSPGHADTDLDRYAGEVAGHLARPGLYVADDALGHGGLTPDRIADLDRLAADTPGPVRIAVVTADSLQTAGWDPVRGDPMELLGAIYDHVGADGTYLLLIDAMSSDGGRSFTTNQWAEDGPTYQVEKGVDDAVDCCAPAYDDMIEAFLGTAGEEELNPGPVIGGLLAGLAVLVAGWCGLRAYLRHRTRGRADREVAEALRPALTEEVIELETRVGALPTYSGDPDGDLPQAVRRVLDLVEEVRHRLDDPKLMDTPEEAEQVTKRLSDARYELVRIDALSAGRPVPERTAPCFFDPRHGPSTDERDFTPEGGKARKVHVCHACALLLDAQQVPPTRMLATPAGERPYWQADRLSRPYVNGYWQVRRFDDDRMERIRTTPGTALTPARPRRTPTTFSWLSDGGSGRGGGWSSSPSGSSRSWSSRSSSRSSSSRRSFGGGRSSSRSSSRSGKSRKF